MFMNQDIKQSDKAGQASIQATLAGLGSGFVQPFLKDCTVKKIKLTQGKVALVDDEDFKELSRFKWQILKCGKFLIARRGCSCPITKNRYTILMHRQITSCPQDLFVDHINHNSLDNRKCNLRICTRQQNNSNRVIQKNKTGIKGVETRESGRYRARIRFNKKGITIGHFDTLVEAINAYNNKAIELFGEFAYLNKL
jgi:hypothetical protein